MKHNLLFRFMTASVVICLGLVVVALVATPPQALPTWYNSAWSSRKMIAVDHRRVLSNLTGFDLLVNLSADADLLASAQANGNDILFTASDGVTKLPHTLTYDGAGNLVARINTNLSSTIDTVVFMYFGNPGASNQQNAAGTWTSFQGVWGGVDGTWVDQTGNGFNATLAGSPVSKPARFGNGLHFNGVNQFGSTSTCPVTTSSNYSFTTWVNSETFGSGQTMVPVGIGTNDALFYLQDYGTSLRNNMVTNTGGGFFTSLVFVPLGNTWQFVAATYDGSMLSVYSNGGLKNTIAYAAGAGTTCAGGVFFSRQGSNSGAGFWRGIMGETKIAGSVLSRAWLGTEFANQSGWFAFYSVGSLEHNVSTVPVIDSFTATYTQVESGKPTGLRWLVRDATSLSINNGVGPQSALQSGLATVSPTSTTTYTVTATNTNGSSTATVTVTVLSGTVVYVRYGGPPGTAACRGTRYNAENGATNAIPPAICTIEAHGLVAGDYVGQHNFTTTDVGSAHNHASNLNGRFIVASVIDATHYTVNDMSGNPITPNDTWADGCRSDGTCGIAAWMGRIQPVNLTTGTRSFLDGTNGSIARHVALSTDSGLATSGGLVCTSGTCVVTTTFTHDVHALDTIAVFNSGNSTVSGEHAVLASPAPTATTYAFSAGSITGDFTSNPHCGPSTGNPHIIGGTANCLTISQFAYNANPFWPNVLTYINWAAAPGSYTHVFDGGLAATVNGGGVGLDWIPQRCALLSFIDRANQPYVDCSVYWLTHSYRLCAINCAPSPIGGDVQSDIVGFPEGIWSVGWLAAWDYQYLQAGEQQSARDLILGDITDPAGTCTAVLPNNPAGTVLVSSTTPNTSVTVTGTGTSFLSDFAVGDGLVELNDYEIAFEERLSMVQSIASNTSMTILLGPLPTLSTTVAKALTRVPKWQSGQCNSLYYGQRWDTGSLGTPLAYFNSASGAGFSLTWNGTPGESNQQGQRHWRNMTLAASLADVDVRAVRLLEEEQQYTWDVDWRFHLGYYSGLNNYGIHYGDGNLQQGDINMFEAFHNNFQLPSLPFPQFQRSWSIKKTFGYQDDIMGCVHKNPLNGGNNTEGAMWIGGACTAGGAEDWPQDAGWAFQPNADFSQRLNNYINTKVGANTAVTGNGRTAWFLRTDPRIGSVSYTTQPTQFFMHARDKALCLQLTGWIQDYGCNQATAADAVISEKCFNSTGTGRACTTISLGGRSWVSGYDSPEDMGAFRIKTIDWLLGNDGTAAGVGGREIQSDRQGGISNPYTHDMVPQFSANTVMTAFANEPTPGVAATNIPRWAEPTVGALGVGYGDVLSRYFYALVDLTHAYQEYYNRVHRHVGCFKKSGYDEVCVQFDDYDMSNSAVATDARFHLFFTQNGEPSDLGVSISGAFYYEEGSTTCLSGGTGCTSTSGTPTVFEQCSNHAADAAGAARTCGLITKIFSPSTFTINYEGTSFTGSYGHANRLTVCAGSSCGSTATKLETVTVHKILTDFNADSTFTVSALNSADTSWTGIQSTNTAATNGQVFMAARGGVLRTNLAITTTHPGTAQYLIASLAPGTYNVTVGGAPIVTGATVQANDNSLYFESTAGAIVVASASTVSSTTHNAGTFSGTINH